MGIEMGDRAAERGELQGDHTKKLIAAAEHLMGTIKGLLACEILFTGDSAPWASSLLELCSMLVQMCRSCVYDNAAFLLLDSMYLFHAWLEQEIVNRAGPAEEARTRLMQETPRINRFINGFIQLTDMITRSGGTIAHMPGYSPLQYHITSSVVEFTQAFYVKKCTIPISR